MPRMTKEERRIARQQKKEERRERRLDRIRSYDEKMKSKRIARQDKKKAKSVRKADRKVKRLEDKLEMTTARSGKADAIYQHQLDREASKDVKKGRSKGRTTILRRKRAKKAQKATSTVLAGLAAKNLLLPGHTPLKGAAQAYTSVATVTDPDKYNVEEDAPTIFEPRLLRKFLLRKKKARVEEKLYKAKEKKRKKAREEEKES